MKYFECQVTAVLALIIFVTTGCSNAQHGTPTTHIVTSGQATSSAASTASSWPSDLPRIPEPIDVTPWVESPCKALTDGQLEELSIKSTPEPGEDPTGPGCNWGDLFEDGITVGGNFGTKQYSTIPGMYKNNETGFYSYFEPVTIAGYPAVFYSDAPDRGNGGCGIAIALREDHTYGMGVRLNNDHANYDEPCSMLEDVAEMAVTTITEGGS